MSKYDDERKQILERMQKGNVSFAVSSTSKYDSQRSAGKSKYDAEREALYNPPERPTEMFNTVDALRNYSPPAVQPDFLKAQPAIGSFAAIQQFQKNTPLPKPEPLPAWKAIGNEALKNVVDTGKSALEVLGRPGNAVRGVIDEATDGSHSSFGSLAGRVGGALTGKEHTPSEKILNNLGWTEMESDPSKQGLGQYLLSELNNKGRKAAGLIGDVGTDPLTYTTFGPKGKPAETVKPAVSSTEVTAPMGEFGIPNVTSRELTIRPEGAGTPSGRTRVDVTPPEAIPPRLDISPQRMGETPPRAAEQPFRNSAIPQRDRTATPKQEVPLREEVPPNRVDVTPEAEAMKGNWFTNLFGNGGVGISPLGNSRRIRRDPLTTEDQLVRKSLRNDKEGIKAEAAAQARAAYQNMVDQLEPLKRINKKTYDTAMDSARANNLASTTIRDKFVDLQGNVIGPSMKDTFNKVARGQDKQFIDYLTLRHAKTRMMRGERVYAESLNMTPEKVQARIDMYDSRHPGFSEIAKEWDGFNDNVLKTYGVDEGLISTASYNALRAKNPNYSPMQRQFSRSEKPGRKFLQKTTSSSYTGQKAPIKEVSPTGSVRNIVDPRKSTIENVAAWTNAAMRNRTMQAMVDAIKRDPDGYKGIAEIVQQPKGKSNLKSILEDEGEFDFIEALNEDFKNLFQTSKVDGDNIVRAMVKGEPVFIKVYDPEVVKTLIGMGPQASNLLVDVMDIFSRATKRGATGLLAPGFAVKSTTMDLVASAIQAKNPLQQGAYTMYSIVSGIADRLGIPGLRNWAQEYKRAGGNFSAAMKADRRINKSISDMTRDPILSGRNILKQSINTIKTPFRLLDAIGDIAENAPRIAAAKANLNRSGGVRTPETVRSAMSAGREATVNYYRKGAKGRDIEAFVPYNNAAVQGMYRFAKTFKDNPVRTAAAVGTLIILPKLTEYARYHNDPDYQRTPAREKFRHLFVNKNADGTFVKVPMEPAYNSIGQLLVESLMKWRDDNPDAFSGSMDALANATTPPLVTGALQGWTKGTGPEGSIVGALNSTVAAPPVALAANTSFTGAPIVPRRLEDNSPTEQYDERTSGVSKFIGDKIGMSPMKVDYLLRAYGGDPARLLLPLSSSVGAGTPRNTLLKNFITDPVFTNTLSEDYYKLQRKYVNAESNNRTNGTEYPEWYDPNIAKYMTSSAAGRPSKILSLLGAEKREVQADKTLSAKDKAQKLRDLQAEMNQVYLDGITTMQESGVPK